MKGNGRKKNALKGTVVKRKYTRRQGQVVMNGYGMEPMVPVCHIERGSGGDVRYSVRVPGLTPDQAREEAQRQYMMLKGFVDGLKAPGQ